MIGYIRKPEEFKLNDYVQYIPTPKVVGVYAVLERDQMVRVPTDAEWAWEDGDDRPKGKHNQVRWQWVEFRTFRRNYSFTLGWQAQEQAGGGWKPLAVHAQSIASQAMTNRTNRVVALLETAGNWGSNTATANTLNGGAGKWTTASDDPASPNYLAIKKSLMEAVRRITLGTNSKVKFKDLRLLVSPGLALGMAEAPEIQNYLRESPVAMAQVRGDTSNYNLEWGLPERLYTLPLVVEDATIVTARPNAAGTEEAIDGTGARTFCKSDTSAVLLSRIGGLDGVNGSPTFSTMQLYHYKGLLRVETFDDSINELTRGNVQENIKEVLAAPQSGFLVTSTS